MADKEDLKRIREVLGLTPNKPAANDAATPPTDEAPGAVVELEAEMEEVVDEQVQADDEDDDDDEGDTASRLVSHRQTPPALPPDAVASWSGFFRREAAALAEGQPERAALMRLEAAVVVERPGADGALIEDVEAAIGLRGDSLWLLPLARRVLMRQRRYERALELCQREVSLGGGNTARTAVLQEAAALVQLQKGDARGALELLDHALRIQPADVALLAPAVALREELGLHEEAADGAEALAAALSVPEERALYLYAAGNLREARLDDAAGAESDYRQALEADAEHLPAAQAICHLYERRGMWPQLCDSLERLAGLASGPAAEARLLYQAGSLHLDRTGDLEAAARDLERASQAAPHDVAVLQRLAQAYEGQAKIEELVATLRRLLELTLDAQGRAALLTHIGWLLQVRLGRTEEAIAAHRGALEAMVGYLPALQALGTLYRQLGRYESLLEIYAPEVEGNLPARARAVRCVEMGDILATKLDRGVDAVGWYRRGLELDPDLHLAFWGLRRLLRQLNRFDELAELLATQAARSKDERTKSALQLELAQLAAGPLASAERAIELLEPIADQDRTRSIAVELLDLYERRKRFAEMVPLLLTQADATQDPAEAQGRRLQAGALLEFALEEHERALTIYRQVLEADACCAAAVRGAGRILHRLGRWNELVKLHYHELVNEPERSDSAILLCRIARLLEENLGQTSAAIRAYSKALEKDAACAPALPAMERLVRGERRWEELIAVLRRHAGALRDRVVAAETLCRAAEVADWQLGDLAQAAALFVEARGLHPESPVARHGLLRVHRRQERWADAAVMLEELMGSSGAEERAQLELELARIKEHRLLQAPDLALYRAAAQGSRYGNRLRAELTRILRAERAAELATWLENLGRGTSDSALAAALLLESARLQEHAAHSAHSVDGGLEAAREAHRRQPDALATIWCFERVLWASGAWAELGGLREREARLELDPSVRAMKLGGAATAQLRAGSAADVARLARDGLVADARWLLALRLLAHLSEQEGQWAELAGLSDRLAEACADFANRLELCLRAADLWATKVGDVARALASLNLVLAEHPGQPDAFAHAEQLLRGTKDFGKLFRLYARRIRSCADTEEKVELLRQHARLLRDDLQDPNQAIAQFTELLTLDPTDVTALSELSELLIRQRHWSDAADKLSMLLKRASDAPVRRRARLQLGELWIRHLYEPRRARDVLGAAVEEDVTDREAKKLLVELASAEGDWEEARRLLEEMATTVDPGERVAALSQLAEVARLGLRDETLRQRCERDALAAAADDPRALDQLTDQRRKDRRQHELVASAEAYLATAVASPVASRLRLLVARLLLEDLGQPAQALERLRSLRGEQPESLEVRLLFAGALEQDRDGQAAVVEYRAILAADAVCVPAYRGLARLMERAGRHETVVAAAALADLVGEATPEETASLKGLDGAMSPSGRLDVASLALSDELRPLRALLAQVDPHLAAVYPTTLTEVLSPRHALAVACQRLAEPLGLGALAVGIGGTAVEAGFGEPIPLLVPPVLAEVPGSAAFRFWIGRALFAAAAHSALIERLDDADLATFAEALTPHPESRAALDLARQLSKALPRKVRKQLEAAGAETDQRRWSRYRAAEQRLADQAGLLISRNPKEALLALAPVERVSRRELTRSARLVYLVQFALSEEYARLARALWS